MRTLLVVNNPKQWPLKLRNVEVVSSRQYLTDPGYSNSPHTRVYNLCRSYGYQSLGYYVSLLAEARGHHPLPRVGTLQDFKSPSLIRFYSEELDELIQKSLAPLQGDEFTLSIYFARNLAKRYDRLSLALFNLFPAPLLRAEFVKEKEWQLRRVEPIPASEIPEAHHEFVIEAATKYFSRARHPGRKVASGYDVAILWNPGEPLPTSDKVAIRKFVRAAESLGMNAEEIGTDDFGRLAEFDALFIRETTSVKNHTFRFSRRAVAEGMVVIDDPESILKCSNKVYLAEALARHKIPAPKTMIIHRENMDEVERVLGLPCVLKRPDSAFSRGVVKVEKAEELRAALEGFLEDSDLVIGQEFLPTEFDWRIGVLDRQVLYTCKYYMARAHWQIVKQGEKGTPRFGRAEAFPLEVVPEAVKDAALRAANLIGDGLYGVDVKEVGGRPYVVEINDNPTLEATCEDGILKDELYLRIMRSFLRRIGTARQAGAGGR